MQVNRLFEIVYLLLNKKVMTAGELASHFEVSKRTVLRDIEVLSAAKIPVYTIQGKGGGISLMDNYVLNKAALSVEEQNQILFALKSVSAAGHTGANEVLTKLSGVFEKTADWIEVDFSRWGNRGPDNEKFEILKRAIFNKQDVGFFYPDSGGEIVYRKVYPLKLVFKNKSWYLQTYDTGKKDYRTFKINRLFDLKLLSDNFSAEDYAAPPIEIYQDVPAANAYLKLRFSPSAAHRIYDEFDEKSVEKNADGSFTVSVDLPANEWLFGFLLSFGDSVKVLEPKNIADNLLKKIDSIKKIY